MKKLISLLLALVLCLSLCACGATIEKNAPAAESSAETFIPTEPTESEETLSSEPSYPVFYDPQTTTNEILDEMVVDQGNRHGMNAFCFDKSWIYGPWAGQSYKGEVAKVRYDNSDWTVIDADTNNNLAACHTVKSGYIYYSQMVDDGMELIKVRSSGEDPKVIVSNHNGTIQVADNFIYYTTPERWNDDYTAVSADSAHLYRCNLEGEQVELVLEKPVYYFSVFGEYVLYQDDQDNSTLHVYNLTTKEDIQINEQRSFWPIYDGNYIYYLSDSTSDESYQHKLFCLSLDGTINEEIDLGCYLGGLLLRGDYIYYINQDDHNRIYRCYKDGSEIELVSQDANVNGIQWVNNCLAYVTVTDDGYIDGLFLCDADGADKVEFCKSNDYWYLG
jgi:hypothetical protein